MLPFALPNKLEKELRPVREYWEGLKRGGNEMPFWDDLKLVALPELKDKLMLIDVFERPERFRFNWIGSVLTERYGKDIVGRFANEIEPHPPFDYMSSQCSASAEGRLPTYYEHAGADERGSTKRQSYARLLLPLWGEGSVRMLLGGVAWVDVGAKAQGR